MFEVVKTCSPLSDMLARFGILCWIVLQAFCLRGAADASRPNILLLFADDLGYETLGSYGGLDYVTPHLDRFAERSIRFTRAYTSPVCTPSRMSYYTGRYTANHRYTKVLPVHLGTREAVSFDEDPSIAQVLQCGGYATSVTGKWQLATLEYHPNHIRDAGFDSWCVWQIWRKGEKTTRYWDPCFNQDGSIRPDITDRFGPDVLADYVIERMRQAKAANQPFYIHHNMLLPHWPILQMPSDKLAGREASLKEMVRYMDGLCGRLIGAVDDLGLRENTWIIFMGDNGTDSKEPRQTKAGTVTGGKHHLVEAGMHVPLMMVGPGSLRGGTVIDDLVDMADFFPTLCELTGLSVPASAQLDGISFAPRLLGKTDQPHRRFVTAGINDDHCVFDGDWRLHQKGTLYDCRALPGESIVTSGHEEIRDRLGGLLDGILETP